MPIKATETDDFESDQPEDDDDSDDDDDVLEDKTDDDKQEVTSNGDALPNDKARDLRLMHLRKGFRLSSMCWDD